MQCQRLIRPDGVLVASTCHGRQLQGADGVRTSELKAANAEIEFQGRRPASLSFMHLRYSLIPELERVRKTDEDSPPWGNLADDALALGIDVFCKSTHGGHHCCRGVHMLGKEWAINIPPQFEQRRKAKSTSHKRGAITD